MNMYPLEDNGFTFVFVNALTGNTTAWNGTVGENVVKEGNGYLAYNFRGQAHSKFDNNIDLNTDVIVEDLIALTNYVNPKKDRFGRLINRRIICIYGS